MHDLNIVVLLCRVTRRESRVCNDMSYKCHTNVYAGVEGELEEGQGG